MSAMLMLTLFQKVNKDRCNAQKHCILQFFRKWRRVIRGAICVSMCVNI